MRTHIQRADLHLQMEVSREREAVSNSPDESEAPQKTVITYITIGMLLFGMIDRRGILKYSSTAMLAGLAGCASGDGGAGRGQEIDNVNFDSELLAGEFQVFPLVANHFCEYEYTYEAAIPDEGFEDAGQVDILVVDNAIAEEHRILSNDIDQNLLNNPSSVDIESSSEIDVDGEVSGSSEMSAGFYYLIIDNTAGGTEPEGGRAVEISVDSTLYKYNRDMDVDSCNNEESGLVVEHINLYGQGLSSNLAYHIAVYDTSGSEYSMSMDLMTRDNEVNISTTQKRDICSTHFVSWQEPELNASPGEELRADISITKDGESYANESIEFTAGYL